MKNIKSALYKDGVLTLIITPKSRPDLAVSIKVPFETEAEALAFARGRCCERFNGKMIFWPMEPDPMQQFC